MTLILSLDTTTAQPTLTLGRVRRGSLVLWWDWVAADRHLQRAFFPAVQQGLAAMQGSLTEVRTIIVGLGPGSFTGAKLGLGFARTLATQLPEAQVFGVPSWFGALPEEPQPGQIVAWTVPSTRHTSYLVAVEWDPEEGLIERLPVTDVAQADIAASLEVFGSNGLVLQEPSLNLPIPEPAIYPKGWEVRPVPPAHASNLLDLYAETGADWEPDDPATLVPLYVRPPQATLVPRPRHFTP